MVCFLILMRYCSVLIPYEINSPLITAKMLYHRVVCGSISLVNQYSVCLFKEESRREKTAYQMWWQSRLVDQSRKAIAIMSITDLSVFMLDPFLLWLISRFWSYLDGLKRFWMRRMWNWFWKLTQCVHLSPKTDNIFALKINKLKNLKPDHVWCYI